MVPILLGLTATALFAASYFTGSSATLKNLQVGAACFWILYGIAVEAVPLLAAGLVVAAAAALSAFPRRPAWKNEWAARLKAGRHG